MDFQLVLLIGVIVVGLGVAIKKQMWTIPVPGRPGYEYQRVFSAGGAGLFFLVAGLIGWTMSRHDAFVAGTHWQDGPIWWQVGVGVALLLLAVFWARRVPSRPTPR